MDSKLVRRLKTPTTRGAMMRGATIPGVMRLVLQVRLRGR